jgi:protein ImuB
VTDTALKLAQSSSQKLAHRRYLALWFPFLPTDRILRKEAGDRRDRPAFALVEKSHGALVLAACDPKAVQLGLTPGLSLADARARHPQLETAEAQREADEQAIAFIAAFCDRFTPLVALDPPHGLVLDLTGCAHLFGGERALLDSLHRRFQETWRLQVRSAIAGTPEAARALARFGRGGIHAPGEEAAAASDLQLVALETSAETALALSRAGFKTLGDLAARPSVVVSARFGEALSRRIACILGREDRRITPLRPLPDCMAERHFAEPLTHSEGIAQVLTTLAADIARALEERGAGGRVFRAHFYRADGVVRHIVIETAQPMRDHAALMRLFSERLEALNDPLDPGFGFDAIRLSIPVCEPLATVQASFDSRGEEDRSLADLIDRLVARFGRDRVLNYVAQETHIPERAAKAAPAVATKRSEAPWPQPQPGEPPSRPLQMFNPPEPIETMAEVPDGPPLRFRWRRVLHEIARAEGPERIAPEWWRDGNDEPTRDYYRVEDTRGRRFWVFRRGYYGEEERHPPRWFLHGVFA